MFAQTRLLNVLRVYYHLAVIKAAIAVVQNEDWRDDAEKDPSVREWVTID